MSNSDQQRTTNRASQIGLGEILTLAGVTRSTLNNWRRRGVFPPPLERPGRRLAWCRADVLAVLKLAE